jgi:transcriptional regulator with XRE-family HTH domain
MREPGSSVLGGLMREAREARGMTQADLARELRIPQSMVSKTENGERKVGVVELVAFCDAVGGTIESIISELRERLARL